MIVKMTILRLLGSSDDKEKEKIGVARPERPPLRGFRYPVSGRGSRGSCPSRVSGQRPESSSVRRFLYIYKKTWCALVGDLLEEATEANWWASLLQIL